MLNPYISKQQQNVLQKTLFSEHKVLYFIPFSVPFIAANVSFVCASSPHFCLTYSDFYSVGG